ncbi:MAG: glycosyltransferase, partial [Actinomycetota bacterium]
MKTTVVIPTYNEIENIDAIVRAVRASVPEADILVVDDNSPDGTGSQAEETAKQLDRVRV